MSGPLTDCIIWEMECERRIRAAKWEEFVKIAKQASKPVRDPKQRKIIYNQVLDKLAEDYNKEQLTKPKKSPKTKKTKAIKHLGEQQ
jgi:hypothetical protein